MQKGNVPPIPWSVESTRSANLMPSFLEFTRRDHQFTESSRSDDTIFDSSGSRFCCGPTGPAVCLCQSEFVDKRSQLFRCRVGDILCRIPKTLRAIVLIHCKQKQHELIMNVQLHCTTSSLRTYAYDNTYHTILTVKKVQFTIANHNLEFQASPNTRPK